MPSGGKGPTCPPLRLPFFPLEIPAFSASNPRDSPLSLKTKFFLSKFSKANTEVQSVTKDMKVFAKYFVVRPKIRKLFNYFS